MKNLYLAISCPWHNKICFMTFSYLHTHTLNNKLIVALSLINLTNLTIIAKVSVTNGGWPLIGM